MVEATDKTRWWKNEVSEKQEKKGYNYSVGMCEIMVQNPISILEKMSTRFLLGLLNERKITRVMWFGEKKYLRSHTDPRLGTAQRRPESDRSSVWAIKEVALLWK